MYNGVIYIYIYYITSKRKPSQYRIANLGRGHRGYGKVDQGQHHMVFGTRW